MKSTSAGPDPRKDRVERSLGLPGLRELLAHKVVPQHKHSIWYYTGGMVLFLFGLQVVTGIMLLLYYRPSAAEAYESVSFIVTQVPWGWLVRSFHSINANLLILALMLHMGAVFFLRAYRHPREFTWISGVSLFFLFIGFGFSGYLLPWNELAYFATAVGTEIPGAMPGIGEFLVRLLRGGTDVSGATLSRFYGLHVAILPALTTGVLAVHLYLVQLHGMSVPRGVDERGSPRPFFPDFLLRDAVGWFVALGLLVTLIVAGPSAPHGALFPFDFLFEPRELLQLGSKADPFASAAEGIKPEWYFLFMYQSLKLIPAYVLGIEGETLGVMAFGVGALVLFVVPFLDRGASGLPSTRWSRLGGSLVVVLGLAFAALGGWSMWVLGSVAGAACGGVAALWILASVRAHRRSPEGSPSPLVPSLGWLAVVFIVALTIVGRLS